ncbi:autotransporter outer membrane beta-barrel domain-containing protein [Variovorax ginsengisoli]|uniref:Outer membrane autotransporter protein n=1 Tax=Variovorax ginsengisoli TaxID=363844 RepID=A0ABT9S8Z8_9BURK|nr:autotransporter domain-containing protein [Variovorax ginsengisoli]MDP9900241.1 outer membrane autotransporter protein [Variovorax ginsengisoli]
MTAASVLASLIGLPEIANAASSCGSGGTLSANSSTCQTLTGGATLTVNSGTTLTNSSTNAVTVSSQTSGVTITNNGTISDTKSGSRAIVINGAAQTNLSITNNGTITASGDDAIHAGSSSTPVTSGTITVVNNGTISATGTTSSTNGQGIDFDNTSGTVVINITNYGTISAADSDAIRPGANATIYNYGTILGSSVNGDTGNDGIDFQSHTGGTVYNYAGATITGARHGITGSEAITVYNAGTITGLLGSGINIDSTSGTTVITNAATGLIVGNASGSTDGDAIDVDYLATINNYGTIAAYGTSTAGLSEAITIGGGTVNNYAGGLIYSVQRAITVDDSNEGNAFGAVSIMNAGTITGGNGDAIYITSAYDNTIDNSGTINGNITITSASGMTAGNNSITNTGTINGSVTTGSGNDTFNLYTGSTVTGTIDGGAGSDTINLLSTTSSGTGTLSNVSNVESLNVESGTWTISDTQAYSSGVSIDSGAALMVDGSLASSAVTVNAGGLLGGNGTVGSLSLLSGSTVSPGHSIGTLTVDGNYTQASGATYSVEVNPNSSASDLIAVSGTATLDSGSILAVSKSTSGIYRIGTVYTVLSAAGGVTGSYTLTGDTAVSAFYGLTSYTDATHVYLAVKQAHAFTAAASTTNQWAVASGLQSLAEGNSLRDAVGYLSSYSAARSAFEQLSGATHASVQSMRMEDSLRVRSAVLDSARAGAVDGCAEDHASLSISSCTPNGRHDWVRVLGTDGHMAGDGNAAATQRSTTGLLAGTDAPISGRMRAGFMLGYDNGKFSSLGDTGGMKNYHAAVYGSNNWGAWGLRVGAAYGVSEIDTKRSIEFSGYSDTLTANYRANTAQAFGEFGYAWESGTGPQKTTVEPFVGLALVNVHTNAFSESGGAAALTGAAENDRNAFSTVGVNVDRPISLAGLQFRVGGGIGWQHAWGSVTPVSSLNFAGGSSFSVSGLPIARDEALVHVGLSAALSKNAVATLAYAGQFAHHTRSQELTARVALQF